MNVGIVDALVASVNDFRFSLRPDHLIFAAEARMFDA